MNRGRRAEAIFRGKKDYSERDSLEDIGREFKVAKYSSVSSVIGRMKTKIAKNRKLKMHIERLKEEINMSQEQT